MSSGVKYYVFGSDVCYIYDGFYWYGGCGVYDFVVGVLVWCYRYFGVEYYRYYFDFLAYEFDGKRWIL